MSQYLGKETLKWDDFVDESDEITHKESFDAAKCKFDLKSIMAQFIIK